MTQTLWENKEWPKCPEHNVYMWYSKYWDQWACQNIECKYAPGVSLEKMNADIMGN